MCVWFNSVESTRLDPSSLLWSITIFNFRRSSLP